MHGRRHSPKRVLISAAMMMAGGLLVVAAGLASPAQSGTRNMSSPAKVGGTLRVNLSTTDVEFTDPSLEYETTGRRLKPRAGDLAAHTRPSQVDPGPARRTPVKSSCETIVG
jgi:hypothetical protein